MKTRWRALVILAVLSVAGVAHAGSEGAYTSVTPTPSFEAEPYAGSQFRAQVDSVNAVAGGTLAIMEQLKPALTFCDARVAGPGSVHVSVATREEARTFAARQPPGTAIDYVDVACPRAYFAAAFASTDAGDNARAIAFLDRAQSLAPYWANAFTERAFLYNAAGDRTHALDSYHHTLALAEAWPSSHAMLGTALRGIGYTLIELSDYTGARDAYQRSLTFDPDNAIAIGELKFIEQNASKGSPHTPVIDTMLSQDETSLAWRQFVFDTRRLEREPFGDEAAAMRRSLLKQVQESKTVTVTVCDVLGLGGGHDHAEPELLMQYLFGNAAFQIERPDLRSDPIAVQLAGVRSTLHAYRAFLAERPVMHLAVMDDLLRHDDTGELDQVLTPIIRKRCNTKRAADAGAKH